MSDGEDEEAGGPSVEREDRAPKKNNCKNKDRDIPYKPPYNDEAQ